MDDTNLNSRQRAILGFLAGAGKVTRQAIGNIFAGDKSVSKITVIRDLNELMGEKLVEHSGNGKARVYFLPQINPLLSFVDLDAYFRIDFDNRKIIGSFNEEIYKDLTNLFSDQEKLIWQSSSEEFRYRVGALDRSIYKRELERFVIEFSWKSAQIEGNTYDLLETETLFTQNIEAKGHTREEAKMLINHKKAFDLILENRNNFKKVTYSDVLRLHGVMTRDLVSSGIRNQPVRIGGTRYIPMTTSSDLESHLRKTIDLINETNFPAQKALIASVMIAYIQPFKDGNKRTARTLANAILLAYDYFPLSYRNVDVNYFKKALVLFYEQNNLYHFKKIFSEQLDFALKNYFKV